MDRARPKAPEQDADKPAADQPGVGRPGGPGPGGMMRGQGRGPMGGDGDNWMPPMMRRFDGPLSDDERSQMIERWRERRGMDQNTRGPGGPGGGRTMPGFGRGRRSPGRQTPVEPKDPDPNAEDPNL